MCVVVIKTSAFQAAYYGLKSRHTLVLELGLSNTLQSIGLVESSSLRLEFLSDHGLISLNLLLN